MALGRAIRAARKERGISQEELAHLAQIDRSYMSGIERGLQNPSVITYVVIAESIGGSVRRIGGRGEHLKEALMTRRLRVAQYEVVISRSVSCPSCRR
mgnify:CR=1 FL=1